MLYWHWSILIMFPMSFAMVSPCKCDSSLSSGVLLTVLCPRQYATCSTSFPVEASGLELGRRLGDLALSSASDHGSQARRHNQDLNTLTLRAVGSLEAHVHMTQMTQMTQKGYKCTALAALLQSLKLHRNCWGFVATEVVNSFHMGRGLENFDLPLELKSLSPLEASTSYCTAS